MPNILTVSYNNNIIKQTNEATVFDLDTAGKLCVDDINVDFDLTKYNGILTNADGTNPVSSFYWNSISTHLETILDYTFAADYTCSEAPNFCDYILNDGQKCVWNKDNNGNLLKAKRVWAAITLTQAISGAYADYQRGTFRLYACCKELDGASWNNKYQDIPSSWWYGDDIGNGAGTAVLTVENIFNTGSLPNGISTCGWFDRETFTGLYGMTANNASWTNLGGATLGIPPSIIFKMNRESENITYKDYIYAVTLQDDRPTKPVPAGLHIKVVAEVYDV